MTDQSWITPALSFAGGLVGGLFAGYFSKRGEIRAVHSELEKVVEQNKKITAATEDIKAKISTKAWARDLKREVSFDALKAFAKVRVMLDDLAASHIVHEGEFVNDLNRRNGAYEKFTEAYDELIQAQIILSVVCRPVVVTGFEQLAMASISIAGDFQNTGWREGISKYRELRQDLDKLALLVRDDLEIPKS